MAADKLKIELLEQIESIKNNPYARPLVQDKYLAYLGLRSKRVNNYLLTNGARSRPCLHGHDRASEEPKGFSPLLFYKIKEPDNKRKKYIYLIRFMYGKRNWIKIFKNESINELM